jgi:hypothetical protein
MTNKTKRILTILLVTVAIAAFAITPLAWFVHYWGFSGAGFTPGENARLPEMVMWMYYSAEEGNDTDSPGEWIKHELTSNKTDSFFLPAASDGTSEKKTVTVENQNGEPEEVEIDSYTFNKLPLQFGKIDNLISLHDDNIVYLRLKVNTETTGCTQLKVDLDFCDDTPEDGLTVDDMYSAVHLYGTDPDISPVDIIKIEVDNLDDLIYFPLLPNSNPLADISSQYCQFMQIAVFVSETEYDPTTYDFKNLPFGNFDGNDYTEFDPIGDEGIVVDLKKAMDSETGEIDDTTESTAVDEAPKEYYVYLKITPKLEFFVLQENLLDQFVPSFLFFDAKLKLELY